MKLLVVDDSQVTRKVIRAVAQALELSEQPQQPRIEPYQFVDLSDELSAADAKEPDRPEAAAPAIAEGFVFNPLE